MHPRDAKEAIDAARTALEDRDRGFGGHRHRLTGEQARETTKQWPTLKPRTLRAIFMDRSQ